MDAQVATASATARALRTVTPSFRCAAQSALGRWLAANAGELSASPAVARLLPAHDEFHRQSRAIADAVREGLTLHMNDPPIVAYLDLSERIEALLLDLKHELHPAA